MFCRVDQGRLCLHLLCSTCIEFQWYHSDWMSSDQLFTELKVRRETHRDPTAPKYARLDHSVTMKPEPWTDPLTWYLSSGLKMLLSQLAVRMVSLVNDSTCSSDGSLSIWWGNCTDFSIFSIITDLTMSRLHRPMALQSLNVMGSSPSPLFNKFYTFKHFMKNEINRAPELWFKLKRLDSYLHAKGKCLHRIKHKEGIGWVLW